MLGAWKELSPYSVLPVGCMIKRLLVVDLAAVLYWVHMKVPEKTRYRRTRCQSAELSIVPLLLLISFTMSQLLFLLGIVGFLFLVNPVGLLTDLVNKSIKRFVSAFFEIAFPHSDYMPSSGSKFI